LIFNGTGTEQFWGNPFAVMLEPSTKFKKYRTLLQNSASGAPGDGRFVFGRYAQIKNIHENLFSHVIYLQW
jgi:hypothetical protein